MKAGESRQAEVKLYYTAGDAGEAHVHVAIERSLGVTAGSETAFHGTNTSDSSG